MKLIKNILLVPILFISLFFINLPSSFSQDCADDCIITETVEIPIDNTPDCGQNHFSKWENRCMKWCDNLNGEYEISEYCPQVAAPVPVNPVSVINNEVVYTPQAPVYTGGVTVTCRGAGTCGVGSNTYSPSVVYTNQVVATSPAPKYNYTFWGGSSGSGQTYNSGPVYNQNTVITTPTAPRVVCPLNYTVSGQDCVPSKKTCYDGSQINFFEQCTKTCWSGAYSGKKIPENEICPSGAGSSQTTSGQVYVPSPTANTINNTNQTKTCPNGYIAQITEPCPAATSWGGSSGSSQYYSGTTNANTYNSSQTKVCKDGNTIYDYQTCTKLCVDGNVINENYKCPAAQNNHQVVTTEVSSITNNSAKCNAIADVVNNTNTTGYFEYGTSASLGKSTNSGNIGYGDNISYTNSIINLEPDTKYYCRAVIVNKDGVYKGDIVSFRTNANKKVYVSTIIEQEYKKEIVSSPVKKSSTKKVAQKKVEVTCKDTAGNTDKLEAGEKFLEMRLENLSGYISKDETSDYVLEYRNKSSLDLESVLISIKIPDGMSFVSTTEGSFSNEEILIKVGDLKSNRSKVINFKLKGDKGLTAGRNIIVQANSSYDMLDENGDTISDENSVYSISTATDKIVTADTTVSKESETFWSGWLFKVLLSLLLLVILFILGRNIYKKIIHKRHADRILGVH
jgi:hypothetical protein